MPKPPLNPLDTLALLRAEGKTFEECAESLDVSSRTCRNWAKKPSVQARIKDIRDSYVDDALGTMRSGLKRAIARIASLIDNGTTDDSVRLSAARGWVQDMMAMAKHSELERRIEALESEGRSPVVQSATRTDSPH